MKTSRESGKRLDDSGEASSGFEPDSLGADHWLWDGEFRASDPALIPLRKRMARAWQHSEMMNDEKELGQLWR